MHPRSTRMLPAAQRPRCRATRAAARGQDQSLPPAQLPRSPHRTSPEEALCWAVKLGREVRDFFFSCVFYGFWGAAGRTKKSTLCSWYVSFKCFYVFQLHLISFGVTNGPALHWGLFPLPNFTFKALTKKILVTKEESRKHFHL